MWLDQEVQTTSKSRLLSRLFFKLHTINHHSRLLVGAVEYQQVSQYDESLDVSFIEIIPPDEFPFQLDAPGIIMAKAIEYPRCYATWT
jgi:hypothetical protein